MLYLRKNTLSLPFGCCCSSLGLCVLSFLLLPLWQSPSRSSFGALSESSGELAALGLMSGLPTTARPTHTPKPSEGILAEKALSDLGPTIGPATTGRPTSTSLPSEGSAAEVCHALKHWLKVDCANDRNTLTKDFTVNMSGGLFHSLPEIFHELYPAVDSAAFDAVVAKHRAQRISDAIISGENEIDVVNAIHELDSDDLLDSFAYFGSGMERDLCDASNDRAVHVANNYIWLPASCKVPFSARLTQAKWPLLPPNSTSVILGNSYNGQLFTSLTIRSILRGEAVSEDSNAALKRCSKIIDDLSVSVSKCTSNSDSTTKYSLFSKTGARTLALVNSMLECLSTEDLLQTVAQLLAVQSVDGMDMILVNDGHSTMSLSGRSQRPQSVAYRLCSAHLNATGYPNKIDSQQLLQVLRGQNYKGLALVSNNKVLAEKNENVTFGYGSAMRNNRSAVCSSTAVPCGRKSSHQCRPGPPDWASEALSTNAYLHYCLTHFPNSF